MWPYSRSRHSARCSASRVLNLNNGATNPSLKERLVPMLFYERLMSLPRSMLRSTIRGEMVPTRAQRCPEVRCLEETLDEARWRQESRPAHLHLQAGQRRSGQLPGCQWALFFHRWAGCWCSARHEVCLPEWETLRGHLFRPRKV